MTLLTPAWGAVSPAFAARGALVEPEATDRSPPRPWLHLPPGAPALLGGVLALALAAGLQLCVAEVRREGLPAVLPIPVVQQHAARSDRVAHHRAKVKLHRALRDRGGARERQAG